MKATEQYFPVVLFIMLYKVVLTSESVDAILVLPFKMKATEQYFPVVLFIMLYKVVLNFVTADSLQVTFHKKVMDEHFAAHGAVCSIKFLQYQHLFILYSE